MAEGIDELTNRKKIRIEIDGNMPTMNEVSKRDRGIFSRRYRFIEINGNPDGIRIRGNFGIEGIVAVCNSKEYEVDFSHPCIRADVSRYYELERIGCS